MAFNPDYLISALAGNESERHIGKTVTNVLKMFGTAHIHHWRNCDSGNLMHEAVQTLNPYLARLALRANCLWNIPDCQGRTALDLMISQLSDCPQQPAQASNVQKLCGYIIEQGDVPKNVLGKLVASDAGKKWSTLSETVWHTFQSRLFSPEAKLYQANTCPMNPLEIALEMGYAKAAGFILKQSLPGRPRLDDEGNNLLHYVARLPDFEGRNGKQRFMNIGKDLLGDTPIPDHHKTSDAPEDHESKMILYAAVQQALQFWQVITQHPQCQKENWSEQPNKQGEKPVDMLGDISRLLLDKIPASHEKSAIAQRHMRVLGVRNINIKTTLQRPKI